ncbi:MAG: helix-turn-helix transcriptional regulator [Eubacterium sp.]|nr:helix-turn-helix transcriptional regulator [Eubacterium sp.]
MSNKIREIRKRRNMTLKQVADRLGVTESTVQRYESGNIKNLKYETMVMLADILTCSPAELMGWVGSVTLQTQRTLRPDESNLLDDYNVLSDIGKNKVTTYTKNLRDVEEAEAFVNAAHERNDIDATEEMFQNDEDIMNDENF